MVIIHRKLWLLDPAWDNGRWMKIVTVARASAVLFAILIFLRGNGSNACKLVSCSLFIRYMLLEDPNTWWVRVEGILGGGARKMGDIGCNTKS